MTATSTYTAYGSIAASSGAAHQPFGLAGQYADQESGRVYLRARYYDPNTAQFLTRDPLVSLTRRLRLRDGQSGEHHRSERHDRLSTG